MSYTLDTRGLPSRMRDCSLGWRAGEYDVSSAIVLIAD